ncbi:MAG TPA: ABC transporter permease subunit [Bryobacteraceae bacterium]|nr:ABC transporter permease subunit [Bryobacteraceae bacterium]
MAVYKRTYKGYGGPLTHPATRFLVLQRYAFKSVFKSRMLLMGYCACFIPCILIICVLYLNQNASVLALIGQKAGVFKINGSFFLNFLGFQSILAGVLTAFIAPSLISPDLTNGALGMYMSRPFSRGEYVLGKGAVIAFLTGAITMLPTLLMFAVQSSLMGWNWTLNNFYLANASFFSCAMLILVLTLLGLAMSALVRWRIVAGALILAVFAIGKGFAAMIDSVMRTHNGDYIDLQILLTKVSTELFQNPVASLDEIPVVGAWIALIAICGFLLWILNRKLRVCEVAK